MSTDNFFFFRSSFLSLILSLPLLGMFYLGHQLRIVWFVPFDLFDWISRALPGQFITSVIDLMVKLILFLNLGATDTTAKLIEQAMAIGLFLLIATLLGGFGAFLVSRFPAKYRLIGCGEGILFSLFVTIIEIDLKRFDFFSAIILFLFFLIWGWLWSELLKKIQESSGHPEIGKKIIISLALTVSLWMGAAYVGKHIYEIASMDVPLDVVRPGTMAFEVMRKVSSVEKRTGIIPAPGTRSEITPNEDFFRIDINSLAPVIKIEEWKIRILGLFDNPKDISYIDLMKFSEVTMPVTLSCISNPVGGDLISTAFFTGIRLKDLLYELGIRKEAASLAVMAIDGYFETISKEDMFDPQTLLVYGMNGRTLTAAQGFPVRFFIPNRYGMKQPKWVTSIEAREEKDSGYWVVRGWSKEARPQTVSVIDTVALNSIENGIIPVGGMAWAGDRGIMKVELKVDQGEWVPVTLLKPPLSPLTWVLWKYDWKFSPGKHVLLVRATDGLGNLQTEERNPPHPSGATGYHQKDVEITINN